MTDPQVTPDRPLTGDCEIDCVDGCAYPGQFSECGLFDPNIEPVTLVKATPQETIRVQTGRAVVRNRSTRR